MTLTIHILSELESELRSRAKADGISVDHYARRVIERHLGAGAGAGETAPSAVPAAAPEAAPFEAVTRVHNMPPVAFGGLRHDTE